MLRTVLTGVCAAAAVLLGAAAAAGADRRPGATELTAGLGFVAEDLQVDDTGRTLVVGQQYVSYASFLDAGVHAFLPDGRRDRRFGDRGLARLPAAPSLSGGSSQLVLQPDGRLLVAELWSPSYGVGEARPTLRRLHANGTPDTTFGTDGTVTPDLGGGDVPINAVAIQADGRILVAGGAERSVGTVRLARLLPSGSPDPAFGHAGRVNLSGPGFVTEAVLGAALDGGVFVFADSSTGPQVARLDSAGRVVQPLAALPLARSDLESVRAGAVPPVILHDGRVRLAGSAVLSGEATSRLAVIGFTAAGAPDAAYGRAGVALAPNRWAREPHAEVGEFASDATLDRAAGVVIAGFENGPFSDHAMLRRFEADGTLDRSFGRSGRVELDEAGDFDVVISRVAARADGGVTTTHAVFAPKYGVGTGSWLRRLRRAPDHSAPEITVRTTCKRVRVRAFDASSLRRVVVRTGGRTLRRTRQARFSVRLSARVGRVRVEATDVVGNRAVRRSRVPRC